MKWIKDQKVEHHLRNLGIKFNDEQVPLSEIDLELSKNKQVRLGPKINDDWVLEYAAAMEAGSPFPMIVLNKMKKGYFIWSGNHRAHAAQLIGETVISAYVVNVQDQRLADILPRVVNAWEGRRSSREEMLIQARYLIENHSVSTPEAASLLGLKPEWITVFMRGNDVLQKITAQGVSANGLPKSAFILMAPLADNANVLRELARTLVRFHLGAGDTAKQVIYDVKGKETEAQRIAEIERWAKLLSARERPTKVKVPYRQQVRTTTFKLLTNLHKLVQGRDTLSQLQIVEEEDVKVFTKLWKEISQRVETALGKVVN